MESMTFDVSIWALIAMFGVSMIAVCIAYMMGKQSRDGEVSRKANESWLGGYEAGKALIREQALDAGHGYYYADIESGNLIAPRAIVKWCWVKADDGKK